MTIPDPPAPPGDLAGDLARLDVETNALVVTLKRLDGVDWARASRCEGWTRGHVATHLARNADSLVNLVAWATTGVVTPQYLSVQARNADIEAGASRPGPTQVDDVVASAARFRTAAAGLSGPLASPVVHLRVGPLPALDIPRRRIGEVVIHHADLEAGWDLTQAQPESLLESLTLSVQRLRELHQGDLTLRTDCGSWVIGTGEQIVEGTRAALLGWLTRGLSDGVASTDGRDLPDLPAWG